jgi:hypothetical protein
VEAAIFAIRTSTGVFGSIHHLRFAHNAFAVRENFLPSMAARCRRRKAFYGLQEFSTTTVQRFLRRKISDPKLACGGKETNGSC